MEKEVNIMFNVEIFYKLYIWLKEKEELIIIYKVFFIKFCIKWGGL